MVAVAHFLTYSKKDIGSIHKIQLHSLLPAQAFRMRPVNLTSIFQYPTLLIPCPQRMSIPLIFG
jgi:hypothetical protein